MKADPRNELFRRIIDSLDDVDLDDFSLGLFTKEKAQEVLERLKVSTTPEEDLYEILIEADCEEIEVEEIIEDEEKPFTIVDTTEVKYGLSDLPNNASNIMKSIGYLQDLIERFKNGEVETMTAVALLKDGRASIWVPNGLDHAKIDELYDPIIEELKKSDSNSYLN